MNRAIKIISIITLVIFLRTGFALAADQVYFYYTDPVGTPLAMSDATGAVVWKTDYLPFGEETVSTSTVENNKMFVGKEKDSESGLNYFGARYMYAPTGRFNSSDSIGPVNAMTGIVNAKILINPQRLNCYVYGLNNPYRYIDADGNIPLDTIWDIGNVIYDIANQDWTSLSVDSAAMMIPYVPAGITKIVKGVDKAADVAKIAKRAEEAGGLWKLTVEGANKIMRHNKFGKFYRSTSDGLWWVKDTAEHGESAFKVYRETSQGLEWYRDADKFGNFMTKHKSDIGKFISWKEFAGAM